MKRKQIYLAGPLLDCTHEESTKWRRKVKDRLWGLYDFSDPVDFQVERSNYVQIVEGDMKAIESSDIVLANCWKSSAGTAMEVCRSFLNGKIKVIVINGTGSAWLRYHSHHCFLTLEEAIQYLEDSHGNI